MSLNEDDPQVAVVIPAYNAAAYLDETLDSVRAQSEVKIEIWVIDDGSTDATPELLRTHEHDIHLLRIENSGGPSRPRNIGIERSRAPFVAFFDADDVMLPRKLSVAVDALSRHPSVGLLCTDFCGIDETGSEIENSWLESYTSFRASLIATGEPDLYLIPADRAYHHLLRANFVGTSSVVCRREALTAVGPFDDSLKNADDIDMWMRIARDGWDFLFVGRVMHRYRVRRESVSTRGVLRYPSMIRGLEKQLAQLDDAADIEFVQRRLSELQLSYGFALRRSGQYTRACRAYCRSLARRRSVAACKGWILARLGL